jgi:uncharacterized protein YgfB (UPF0149 family)
MVNLEVGVTIMKQSSLPNYQDLDHALNFTVHKLHPSLVHGLACGLISGKLSDKQAWELLIEECQKSNEAHEILYSLFEASRQQLDEFLFDFQLVLPPDSVVLSVRAEALTLWCQGYLTGLKLAQVEVDGKKTNEMNEAIEDLIEIAKMNYEEVVSSDEDEAAYVELIEYVRMAAILIHQELHENDTIEMAQGSHHLH